MSSSPKRRASVAWPKRLLNTLSPSLLALPGTGKTYTAVAFAVKALKERTIRKIILTRPAVEAGESLGFLPGDLKEKIAPYLRPLYDSLEEMLSNEKLEQYLAQNIIEIAPSPTCGAEPSTMPSSSWTRPKMPPAYK
jgi:hypothetical protein